MNYFFMKDNMVEAGEFIHRLQSELQEGLKTFCLLEY